MKCVAAVAARLIRPARTTCGTVDREKSTGSAIADEEKVARDRGDMRESAVSCKCPQQAKRRCSRRRFMRRERRGRENENRHPYSSTHRRLLDAEPPDSAPCHLCDARPRPKDTKKHSSRAASRRPGVHDHQHRAGGPAASFRRLNTTSGWTTRSVSERASRRRRSASSRERTRRRGRQGKRPRL